MKKVGTGILIILCVMLVLAIVYVSYTFYLSKTEQVLHPVVNFEIENYGNIKMELYPEYAPNTVANIIKLVEAGYYNGKTVYGKDELCLYVGRSEDGTVQLPKVSLIDSSVEKDSELDFEYEINGEFIANGFNKNTLRHDKGVVTLIRTDYTTQMSNLVQESFNSGSGQIGVIINENRNLNGVYAGFGKIIEGLEILEKINNESEIVQPAEGEATGGISVFNEKIIIKNATVDTNGLDYGTPEIHQAFDYTSYLYDMLNQSNY